MGATNNTAIGSKLLQYKQVHSSISILQGADILIHAYSTNDAVSNNGQGNKTLNMLQEFVRLALQPPVPLCKQLQKRRQQQQQQAPLLIRMNDFIGPTCNDLFWGNLT
jgi:hypothetical protein